MEGGRNAKYVPYTVELIEVGKLSASAIYDV
jgi:hypothetical protein